MRRASMASTPGIAESTHGFTVGRPPARLIGLESRRSTGKLPIGPRDADTFGVTRPKVSGPRRLLEPQELAYASLYMYPGCSISS